MLKRNNKGFGLVEMLMALMVMGMLLTAIAAAIHASLRSYGQNDNLVALSQSSRSVMGRISFDLRTADDASLSEPSTRLTILRPDDGSGQSRQVQYEFMNGLLYYREIVNGVTTINQVMLGTADDVGVTAFVVSILSGQSAQGLTCAKTVTVQLDLVQEGLTQSTTIAISPRRNQTF